MGRVSINLKDVDLTKEFVFENESVTVKILDRVVYAEGLLGTTIFLLNFFIENNILTFDDRVFL